MSEIGIQSFAARYGEEHRSKNGERYCGVFGKKREGIKGIYRRKHIWLRSDTANAKDREHDKPHHHQRPEQAADRASATTLQSEKPQQRDNREREYSSFKGRGCDAYSLQGTQHGHCRGNHAVAVKKCASDEPECPDHRWTEQRLLVE